MRVTYFLLPLYNDFIFSRQLSDNLYIIANTLPEKFPYSSLFVYIFLSNFPLKVRLIEDTSL